MIPYKDVDEDGQAEFWNHVDKAGHQDDIVQRSRTAEYVFNTNIDYLKYHYEFEKVIAPLMYFESLAKAKKFELFANSKIEKLMIKAANADNGRNLENVLEFFEWYSDGPPEIIERLISNEMFLFFLEEKCQRVQNSRVISQILNIYGNLLYLSKAFVKYFIGNFGYDTVFRLFSNSISLKDKYDSELIVTSCLKVIETLFLNNEVYECEECFDLFPRGFSAIMQSIESSNLIVKRAGLVTVIHSTSTNNQSIILMFFIDRILNIVYELLNHQEKKDWDLALSILTNFTNLEEEMDLKRIIDIGILDVNYNFSLMKDNQIYDLLQLIYNLSISTNSIVDNLLNSPIIPSIYAKYPDFCLINQQIFISIIVQLLKTYDIQKINMIFELCNNIIIDMVEMLPSSISNDAAKIIKSIHHLIDFAIVNENEGCTDLIRNQIDQKYVYDLLAEIVNNNTGLYNEYTTCTAKEITDFLISLHQDE